MIVTAYFDESGTHRGSKAVSVAGFVADADAWVEFSAQWQIALNDYSLSHHGFHMTDFANCVKPYNTWTEKQRRERLARLLNIIQSNVLGSVGTVIPLKYFNDIFTPRTKAICGGAYGLAAVANFMALGEILRHEQIDSWVNYVFESGAKGSGQILKVFNSNVRYLEMKERYRLLSLRFEDKRALLPLQAADIIAYELYKEMPRQLKKHGREVRYPLSALSTIPRSWGWLEDKELRKWSEILSIRTDLEDSGELKTLK